MQSIEVFVRVAELGSFTRASERLNLSNATTTRHVAHLEGVFGGRLLDRTTRRLRLTQAGQACLEHCRRVLQEVAGAEHAVREGTGEPQGTLRVVASSLFWMREISPRLPDFLRRYPKVTMHVNLTESQPDLLGEDYDLSLQFISPASQSLIRRRLRTLHRVVCAAPDYLARMGIPATPEDLTRHNCLLYARSAETVEWKFRRADQQLSVYPNGNLRSTDALTLRQAALAGLGIVRSPRFLVESDIAAGSLVPLLPGAESVDPDLYVVFPSRKLMPAKLRVFLDFVEREFAAA
ncbi:MAG TPA: LysR family transcriptional regulator [Rhodopila sp.]